MTKKLTLFGLQKKLKIPIASLATLLAFISYVECQAHEYANLEAECTARVIVNQIEVILDQFQESISEHTLPPQLPCDAWAKQARIAPYLRSVYLAKDGWLYCSTATGIIHAPLNSLVDVKSSSNNTSSLSTGTPFAPTKHALIYYHAINSTSGAVAIIESRYLLDLLKYPSKPSDDPLSLRLVELNSNSLAPPIKNNGESRKIVVKSSRYQISVSTYQNPLSVIPYRLKLTILWLPWALVLGVPISIFAYRSLKKRRGIHAELQLALAQNEFFVCYQPIINSNSGKCTGVEALLRWKHPIHGLISPDLFIAQAESCGMIIELTHRLFSCVRRDLSRAILPAKFHVGLNIASEHFNLPTLLDDLISLRSSLCSLDPIIVVEITERQIVTQDEVTQEMMTSLRRSGVELAIDDFGTGQSSLAYLQRFDVDYLKIDKYFVSKIGQVSVNSPVLDTIIDLAKRLELKLIAEGVENKTQADYLKARGVNYLQGYLFAKPMIFVDFEKWLRMQSSIPSIAVE